MSRMRSIALVILCVPFALTGCNSSEIAPDLRMLTFDVVNEEPEGLYVVELQDEECAQIEEDIVIDVMGHTCGLDRAYLRNAIVNFTHRGRPIINGNGHDHDHGGLHFWMVHREGNEIWYYIGTREQYAALDRNRPFQVGSKTLQF